MVEVHVLCVLVEILRLIYAHNTINHYRVCPKTIYQLTEELIKLGEGRAYLTQITTITPYFLETLGEMTPFFCFNLEVLVFKLLFTGFGNFDNLVEKGVDLGENCVFGAVDK